MSNELLVPIYIYILSISLSLSLSMLHVWDAKIQLMTVFCEFWNAFELLLVAFSML